MEWLNRLHVNCFLTDWVKRNCDKMEVVSTIKTVFGFGVLCVFVLQVANAEQVSARTRDISSLTLCKDPPVTWSLPQMSICKSTARSRSILQNLDSILCWLLYCVCSNQRHNMKMCGANASAPRRRTRQNNPMFTSRFSWSRVNGR